MVNWLFLLNNLDGTICDNKDLGIIEDCQVGWTITYVLQCVEKEQNYYSGGWDRRLLTLF